MMAKLAQFTDVRVALVVGGLSLQVQAATLRTQPEVVVATPVRGRSPCIWAQGSGLLQGPPKWCQLFFKYFRSRLCSWQAMRYAVRWHPM